MKYNSKWIIFEVAYFNVQYLIRIYNKLAAWLISYAKSKTNKQNAFGKYAIYELCLSSVVFLMERNILTAMLAFTVIS